MKTAEELKDLEPIAILEIMSSELDDLQIRKNNVNLYIAKIREFNKRWNAVAELKPNLKTDGFLMVTKKIILECDYPEALKRAAKYL